MQHLPAAGTCYNHPSRYSKMYIAQPGSDNPFMNLPDKLLFFHIRLEIFLVLRENRYNLFCSSAERVVPSLED